MIRPWLLLCIGLATATAARDTVRRDVEGYAVASCLGAQKSSYLKDQADGWAANIVQRDSFRLPAFAQLDRAVKAEVARGHMATIITEDPPMTVRQLPVQYCAELIDAPRVRAAIERTIAAVGRPRR